MSKDFFVFAEQRKGVLQKVGLELLGEAQKLAADLGQKVVGVLIGDKVGDKAARLFEYGADKVIVVEDAMLDTYVTEPYAKALTSVIKEYEPEIVLFGATAIGRDLAPRVASRIHTGLTADCTGLAIDPETKLLMMTRPAFGGNIMATIVCREYRPQMATVRPGVMQMAEPDKARKGDVVDHKVPFAPEDMNVEVLEIIENSAKAVDITEAKILISGGRGVGGPEGYGPLRALAAELAGEVSASRIGVDSGWIEKPRQVGQTGKTVRPNLYMACGISGAIQHMAGMEDADFILAINKDATAPMMAIADLGIVGDLKAIIPKLTEAVKKHKASKAI
ncbi:MAG: electron transfer flavoprotein subunit alpha/FixB family protein [Oscillospiraceae bacterium]